MNNLEVQKHHENDEILDEDNNNVADEKD